MQFLRCECQIFIDGSLLKYLPVVFIYGIYLSTESISMCLAAAFLVALARHVRECLSIGQYPSSCNIYSQYVCTRDLPMSTDSV